MRRIHADLLLLGVAAIWGIAFVFQKTAMAHIGPLLFIALRTLVAAAALAPWAWREANPVDQPVPSQFLKITVVAAIAFFLGAVLQQYGLVTATVSNSGFLTALYIVFVPLIGRVTSAKRLAWTVWPAIVLSFLGTWLLGGATFSAFSFGDVLVAVCAVFWAVHVVVTGEAADYRRPITFTCLQFVLISVASLVAAAAFETISIDAIRAAWLQILFVGLLSSALTFTLFSFALRYTPPAEAAVIVSTESLFAAMAGAVLLGERLGLIAWLGAGFIVVATLLVQLGPTFDERRHRAATRPVAERL
jgi:drug/metabolite transporter (DMT)-like permease